MSTHSCIIAPHLKDALSTAEGGKYGRMFPGLRGPWTNQTILLKLGKSGSIMDAASRPEDLMRDLLSSGLKFYMYPDQPYIPVEFADAAYRYGHSQVRSLYTLNDGGAKG
jgi:hypothetical protein